MFLWIQTKRALLVFATSLWSTSLIGLEVVPYWLHLDNLHIRCIIWNRLKRFGLDSILDIDIVIFISLFWLWLNTFCASWIYSFSDINEQFCSFNLPSESKSAIHPVLHRLSCPLRIHNRFFGALPQQELFFDHPPFFCIELSQNIIAEISCPLVKLQNKKTHLFK